MKKNNYTYAVILSLVLPLLATGCGSTRLTDPAATVIDAVDYDSHEIDDRSFIARTRTMELKMKDGALLAGIHDICADEQQLYVLDQMKTITSFNVHTGVQTARIDKVGHAAGEYVNPMAITCSKDTVYVLDLSDFKIICYNTKLQYLRSIRLPGAALDFAKVSDGFLLFNPNPSEPQVIHIDNNGKSLGSYLPASTSLDLILSDKAFSEGENENVYFIAPATNAIYLWQNGALNEAFKLNFDSQEVEAERSSEIIKKQKANVMNAFVSHNYVMTLFLAKFVTFSIYRRSTGKTESGFVNISIPYPFRPKILHGNTLIDIEEASPSKTQKSGNVAIFYELRK